MACLSVPALPYPNLSLFLPTLSLSVPTFGLNLCCTFETPPIPGFPIILPVGAILALLGPAGDAVIATILAVVDLLNALLDQIPPVSCPLD